jgi:hypothetical protein
MARTVRDIILRTCTVCSEPFESPRTGGRRPEMCSAACRRVAARRHQRNYMARLIESRVPRQAAGRSSVSGKLAISGSARPRWTSLGRFQASASCGRTVFVLDPVVLGVRDQVQGVGNLFEEQLLVLQRAETALT